MYTPVNGAAVPDLMVFKLSFLLLLIIILFGISRLIVGHYHLTDNFLRFSAARVHCDIVIFCPMLDIVSVAFR